MARKQPPAALARNAAADLASGAALGGMPGLRQRMLELAGVNDAEQALLTRLVINKFRDLLHARAVTRLVVGVGRGMSEVQAFEDDDLAMQARAAAELTDILGLKPSKSAGISSGGGPMTVNVSFAERPVQQVEVIEVPANSA